MSELLAKVDGFFGDVNRRARDEQSVDFKYDSFDFRRDWLGTFAGSEHRKSTSEGIDGFLERRLESYEGNETGIIEFGPSQAILDFQLGVNPEDNAVQYCNCGFFAIVRAQDSIDAAPGSADDPDLTDPKGQSPLAVGLRYESDFENVGRRWVDHPHHHIHWEAHPPKNRTGATETHIRVAPMLPTHFFEFCARHYFPALWHLKFEPVADQLQHIAETVNDASESDQRRLASAAREEARDLSSQIEDVCSVTSNTTWEVRSEGTVLPL